LPEGLYESLLTDGLRARLEQTVNLKAEMVKVPDSDEPEVLSRHVAGLLRKHLADVPKGQARVDVVNRIVESLSDRAAHVLDDAHQLRSLVSSHDLTSRVLPSPSTPLSDAALLTNAKDEPVLGAELRSELASADRVDLLCAFVRWHGLRVLEEPLAELQRRGVPIRVITTTYLGSTERRALDELVRRFGAEVKVNYETQSTRLHAKAWLLRRNSGFDTAYVGSSNLSRAALIDGLEWNVRLSSVATPTLTRKFEATFDSYWLDPGFQTYDPDSDADLLDSALRSAGGEDQTQPTMTLAGLEVRPFPHQTAILEALELDGSRGRHRNLVVTATGTGKTVVAALDYRNLRDVAGKDLRLLFVAHREEILKQSLRAYREVLGDGSFGELYVGGYQPEKWNHVFASVQSLAPRGVDSVDPAHFDVVVIDEFHHAAAPTYKALLSHLRSQELLGLTATPERADGFDVRAYFDGRSAYELRLWDALEQDLLVPFHYFGVADDVDLSGLEWKRGSYDLGQLGGVYTGNDARVLKVLKEMRDKVTDVGSMRAIGFCVSVPHAEYMARKFNDAGIPSMAVSGETDKDVRSGALEKLRRREVNCLFAADLYNEGLDLPEVDTILMLRPTSSATIFLQQLGRGLRRARGKAVLTVLDFIGNQNREFRFDLRYRSLTGSTRKRLVTDVEEGFPYLPAGSQVVLDRVSREIVLNNVREQLRLTGKQLVAEVRRLDDDAGLAGFLRDSGMELPDIYRSQTWTELLRKAGKPTLAAGPSEPELLRRIRTTLHVDDDERADLYRSLLSKNGPNYSRLSDRDQRIARMLLFTIWPKLGVSYDEALALLRAHRAVCHEISELISYSLDKARNVPRGLGEGLQHVPVQTHASYKREEILAAFGWANENRKPGTHVTGVAWCEETRTDVILVNLHKSEEHFSPNTMYRDYALSSDHFHWESQNATRESGPVGRRYRSHQTEGSRVVLFVRNAQADAFGAGAPFVCLGQVEYVSHVGEKPMAITWRLHRPMPSDVLVTASAVAR